MTTEPRAGFSKWRSFRRPPLHLRAGGRKNNRETASKSAMLLPRFAVILIVDRGTPERDANERPQANRYRCGSDQNGRKIVVNGGDQPRGA